MQSYSVWGFRIVVTSLLRPQWREHLQSVRLLSSGTILSGGKEIPKDQSFLSRVQIYAEDLGALSGYNQFDWEAPLVGHPSVT